MDFFTSVAGPAGLRRADAKLRRGKAPEPSAAGEALVDGFYFEVNDAGTMLISGRNRASKVYERIVHEAGLLTKPLTQGR